MTRARLPLAPGHVRRLSPTVCAVEPFPGSSDDDRTQLQWLARAYARRVPFGGDWPVQRWAQEIGFHDGDHAGRVWLLAYARRFGVCIRYGNPHNAGDGSAEDPRAAIPKTMH